MELDRVSGKPTAGTEPENLSPAWGPPTQASLGERGVGPAGKAGRKAPLGALPVENVPVAALLAAAAGGDAAVQVHQPRAKELHDLRQHHWGAAGRGVGWAQVEAPPLVSERLRPHPNLPRCPDHSPDVICFCTAREAIGEFSAGLEAGLSVI